MVSGPLPLPESAFKNWKALAREFQRAMAVVASDDVPLAVKQSHALMIGHIRRILHPSRINHSALLREDAEQANPDYTKALAAEWDRISNNYAAAGFCTESAGARQKADILREIGRDILPERQIAEAQLRPSIKQKCDLMFENDKRVSNRQDLTDIRAQFESRPELYNIMSDEAFNVTMVERICAMPAIIQEIAKNATQPQTNETLVSRSVFQRKAFARAVVESEVVLLREVWEYLPRDKSDNIRRSLWTGKDGLLSVHEFRHGTDEDVDPFQVDVTICTWADGAELASFIYEQSTKASRAVQAAIDRQPVDRFMDAVQRLSEIGKSGVFSPLTKVPVLGSLVIFMGVALHPRLNFIVFRGMAQQGVKSWLILRHLSRVAFWLLVFGAFGVIGVIPIILREVAAGFVTGSDIAFLLGLGGGVLSLCQAVPTSLGLLIGSFERRSGRGWSSNLPQTGHENFITRRKSAKPWGRST